MDGARLLSVVVIRCVFLTPFYRVYGAEDAAMAMGWLKVELERRLGHAKGAIGTWRAHC